MGNLEQCDRECLKGWAFDPTVPDEAVQLEIWCDGKLIGQISANAHRGDLQEVGYLGAGRCAFCCAWVVPPNPFASHIVDIRRTTDGTSLRGSPCILSAAVTLDDISRDGLAQVLRYTAAAASEAGQLDTAIDYLMRQAEALLSARARLDGKTSLDAVSLQDRWGRDAASPAIASAPPPLAPQALFLDEHFPLLGDNAGANAALDHMRSLRRVGFDVRFAATQDLADQHGNAPQLATSEIAALTAPWYGSIEEILRRHAGQLDLVYLHRAGVASAYAKLVRHYCPKAMLVYGVADLHYLRLGRQGAAQNRPRLQQEARRLQFEELTAARWADVVVTHSIAEAELLRSQVPGVPVMVVPWAIPLRQSTMDFEARRGVAFIGNFTHAPNVDAVHFLATTILPWMRRRKGADIPIRVIGSNMPPQLYRMAQPGLEVIGAVDDVGDALAAARLTVAPLRFGAGIKGKVVESLAAGVPCIGTSIAFEGMELPQALQGCIADTPEAFVDAIVHFYNDPEAHATVGAAGRRHALMAYGKAAVDAQMRQLTMPALRRWAGATEAAAS